MTTLRIRRNFYVGVVLHGTTIWLSELLGAVLLGILVLILGTFSTFILYNNNILSKQAATLAAAHQEKVIITHQIDELRARQRIAVSLRAFVGAEVPPDRLARLINLVYENSVRFGYDPLLVLAVIHVESVFNAQARGRYRSGASSGAMGLMQVKYETALGVARELGISLKHEDDLLNPDINVVIGIAYLTKLITRFKSFKLGILAYNQGPGVIRQNLSSGTPLSITYFNKVLKSYLRFCQISDPEESWTSGVQPTFYK